MNKLHVSTFKYMQSHSSCQIFLPINNNGNELGKAWVRSTVFMHGLGIGIWISNCWAIDHFNFTLRVCLKWVKIRGNGMKMKVKIISLIWIWSKNEKGGKIGMKTIVWPTKNIHSKVEMKTWLKTSYKTSFQNCPFRAWCLCCFFFFFFKLYILYYFIK